MSVSAPLLAVSCQLLRKWKHSAVPCRGKNQCATPVQHPCSVQCQFLNRHGKKISVNVQCRAERKGHHSKRRCKNFSLFHLLFCSWLMLGLWSYAYAYDDPYVVGLTSFVLCFAFCFALMLKPGSHDSISINISISISAKQKAKQRNEVKPAT